MRPAEAAQGIWHRPGRPDRGRKGSLTGSRPASGCHLERDPVARPDDRLQTATTSPVSTTPSLANAATPSFRRSALPALRRLQLPSAPAHLGVVPQAAESVVVGGA